MIFLDKSSLDGIQNILDFCITKNHKYTFLSWLEIKLLINEQEYAEKED